MPITIRAADLKDARVLARMNSRLVEDQGTVNTWSLAKYEQRFLDWLQAGTWQVDIILEDGQIIGYAVYQQRGDYYNPEQPVIYVRQYYIERTHRRRGLGRAAFQELIDRRFPTGYDAIELDVVATNPGGQQFWTKLGFAPYFIAMKKQNNS
jgi:GNAT superfamily N-acetyltransferase